MPGSETRLGGSRIEDSRHHENQRVSNDPASSLVMPIGLQPCNSQPSGAVPWESRPVHEWEEVNPEQLTGLETNVHGFYPMVPNIS